MSSYGHYGDLDSHGNSQRRMSEYDKAMGQHLRPAGTECCDTCEDADRWREKWNPEGKRRAYIVMDNQDEVIADFEANRAELYAEIWKLIDAGREGFGIYRLESYVQVDRCVTITDDDTGRRELAR